MKMPSLVARRLGRSRRREESSSAARKKFGRQAATVTAADEEGTSISHRSTEKKKKGEWNAVGQDRDARRPTKKIIPDFPLLPHPIQTGRGRVRPSKRINSSEELGLHLFLRFGNETSSLFLLRFRAWTIRQGGVWTVSGHATEKGVIRIWYRTEEEKKRGLLSRGHAPSSPPLSSFSVRK